MSPIMELFIEGLRYAVKVKDEAILAAVTKFAADPVHYLSWGDERLISTLYEAELAEDLLEAPELAPRMVILRLRELRKRELGRQLMFSGEHSTNPYANATASSVAAVRCRFLEHKLSEAFIDRLVAAERLCPGCLCQLPDDVTSVPGHYVCSCGHRTYFEEVNHE